MTRPALDREGIVSPHGHPRRTARTEVGERDRFAVRGVFEHRRSTDAGVLEAHTKLGGKGPSNLFRAELARMVALALFIPVVLNLAESVSSQSVILPVHILDRSVLDRRSLPQWLRRELPIGVLLGVACGAILGAAELAWLPRPWVAAVLFVGISIGVSVSALFGAAMPIVSRALRLDPKVAAGPIALACADVATLLAYLSAARWLLSQRFNATTRGGHGATDGHARVLLGIERQAHGRVPRSSAVPSCFVII